MKDTNNDYTLPYIALNNKYKEIRSNLHHLTSSWMNDVADNPNKHTDR